jgi:hypothetical protein
VALVAGNNDLQLGRRIFRQLLRILNHFGMMVTEQANLQRSLEGLPLFGAKLVALVVPPFKNAAVTDRRTRIEKRGWVGTAKKRIAPWAGLDS